MAIIGPTYKGVNLDIVTPFQSAADRDYKKFRDINKNIQEGMLAFGKGVKDARRDIAAEKWAAEQEGRQNRLNELYAALKNKQDELSGVNASRDEAKGLVANTEAYTPIEGSGYPYSNSLPNDIAYSAGEAEYYGRTKNAYNGRVPKFYSYKADPRKGIMPYKESEGVGPSNYGEEDYNDRFIYPAYGRKSGLF